MTMTRKCFICRRDHDEDLVAVVVMKSSIVTVPVDAFLCSDACAAVVAERFKPEVDERRKLAALKEMLSGI